MASFSWKNVLPRTKPDRLAVFVAVLELTLVPIFEVFVIMPPLFGLFTLSFWMHFLVGFYLWFNAVGNMIMVMGTEISSGKNILPSVLKTGWRYCPVCMLNAPPRAHHCGDCNTCVLVRDHHCVFTGRCVGHNNMRYYLMMVVFLFCSAMYCNYLNIDYAWELVGGMHWKGIITMFIPAVGWLFGYHSTMSFFSTVQCGICLFGSLQFLFLLIFHVRLVAKGITTYEWRHSAARRYNRGWKENLKAVLGSRWYLVWIAPFFPSPLLTDGINFPEQNGTNNVKDM
ncbi:putative palmitoyltransferase ZDHHC24 [Apostichopus japonicus]|uniref:Palmitoyltransferase n=1 Tax=Stichopus japonicus TaxID=307972 RepID=A0A2G8JIP3_STIJA|nr:putative palmitoyltransferase ZDHHC24 [Apostichopus japonicus]